MNLYEITQFNSNSGWNKFDNLHRYIEVFYKFTRKKNCNILILTKLQLKIKTCEKIRSDFPARRYPRMPTPRVVKGNEAR